MRALASVGFDCVGIEVNERIAAEARAEGLDVLTLDMRELDRLEGRFDGVISMWASFGWFDDETNAQVLRTMAAKLTDRGRLVLEVYNADFFRSRQGAHEIKPGIIETKMLDGRRLTVRHDYGFEMTWRLYEPEELAALAGLSIGLVERGDELPRMRVVIQASPASSGASAAAPSTSGATMR
jgi:Methyltransferase domain